MINARKVFGSYVVDRVDVGKVESASTTRPPDSSSGRCCIPSEWTGLTLLSVTPCNHDTSLFKFQLPLNCSKLNLPIGGFLLVRAPDREHGGGDAIRPYTSVQDDDLNAGSTTGTLELLCKRYDQWGVKESLQTHFLFTKTDHSYRPPGAVSNFIHQLKIGDQLMVKHTEQCRGKVPFPFPGVRSLTLVAVGAGIAPMVQILRGIFKSRDYYAATRGSAHGNQAACEDSGALLPPSPVGVCEVTCEGIAAQADVDAAVPAEQPPPHCGVEIVVLLYGVRTVADILMREQLQAWQERYGEAVFKVVFCVGSRWSNVHWGAKTKGKAGKEQYVPPPLPAGFQTLKHAALGWVNEERIREHGFPPSADSRVIVCGLPGVYDKLCGGRDTATVAPHSVLHRLGYTEEHVIKL